jgi:hypothetical protein
MESIQGWRARRGAVKGKKRGNKNYTDRGNRKPYKRIAS